MPRLDTTTAISLPEAAKMACVSPRHMRTLIDQGRVAGAKIGRNYIVDPTSAAAFHRHPSAGRPRKSL